MRPLWKVVLLETVTSCTSTLPRYLPVYESSSLRGRPRGSSEGIELVWTFRQTTNFRFRYTTTDPSYRTVYPPRPYLPNHSFDKRRGGVPPNTFFYKTTSTSRRRKGPGDFKILPTKTLTINPPSRWGTLKSRQEDELEVKEEENGLEVP